MKDAGATVLVDVESGRGICCAGYLGRILDVALPSHNKLMLGLPFHMGQRVGQNPSHDTVFLPRSSNTLFRKVYNFILPLAWP